MSRPKKPHRSLADRLLRRPKTDKPEDKAGFETYTDLVNEADKSQPAVLEADPDEPSLWKRAWEQVRKEIKKEDKTWEPPPELTLDTPTKDEVGRVREAAQKRAKAAEDGGSKVAGTQHTYREVYGQVAKWADKFSFVGDLVVQADPGYATVPWALIRFAITSLSREDATWHTMLEGMGLISELIPQYMVIEQTYAQIDSELSDALVRELLTFYVKILYFQIRSIDYFDPEHKGRRSLQGLNPVTAEDIKQERAAIDKARERVDHDISLVHYDATKRGIEGLQAGQGDILSALLDLTSSVRMQVEDADCRQKERTDAILEMWKEPLDTLMSRLDDERERKELFEIRRWLSKAKPEEDYEDAKAKRPMPLGDWLFNHPVFTNWRSSVKSKFLWLHGFTGTGKTGLVGRAIHHLRESAGEDYPTQLAFFYCSNDRADSGWNSSFDRSDPEEVFRSLVSQLAVSQQGKTAASIVKDKYAAFGPRSDKYRQLNYSDCVDILLSISKDKAVTIVLDGLNECDQNKAPILIQHLKTVVAASRFPVKILISTRPFPAIENEIVPEHSIEVNAENNRQDVNRFIKETLRIRIANGDLLNGQSRSENLVPDIEETLTSRAQNMFLYASLLLDRLCDRSRNDNEVSIRRKLKELPNSLADGYNRIMEEVHDDKNNSRRSCDIAQHTFKWLLLAQESLQCASLVEAVSPPESKTDVNEVLRACRTLVVKSSFKERVIFEFAHYSVREHISRMAEYNSSQCHLIIATSCLRNLNVWYTAESQKGELPDSQRSLGRYAELYWPVHYEGIKRGDLGEHRATINNLLRGFLLQRRSSKSSNGYAVYAEWFAEAQKRAKQLQDDHHLASKMDDLEASPATPLFAACVFGLEDIIGKFGRELDGLNKCNSRGQTAICLAIKNNKLDVVKALLSRRFPAEVNLLNVKAVQQFQDFDISKPPVEILFACALQCAAATGRLEIAEYLIERGAHIDLVAGYYGSPLQAAALNGHQSIVALLLRHGPEPNSQGGCYGNALQAAAATGHSKIVNLLLENKPPALVSTPGGRYGNALMGAIHSGSSDTVLELLEEGADPNVEIRAHGRPLEKSASMGPSHRAIVSLLLAFKATADLSPNGNAVHILHRAALNNMIDLAGYCLDHGCKIDMITTQGPWYPRRYGDFPSEMTPLAFACAEGHVEMAACLLGRGAPLEYENPNTALLWTAAYQGHADIAEMLIGHFKERHGPANLHKFFEQRPSPKSGHPLLFAAASSGKVEVVRTLLDHGVKYESNWFGATPLKAAASFQAPDVVDLLLEYDRAKRIDVQINQHDGSGRTALWAACASGQPRITETLLKAGADYLIGGNGGSSPLHVAGQQESHESLALVLERASKDADTFSEFINRKNWAGRTALIESAEKDRLHNVNLLLENGADCTIIENEGNTALHYAARSGADNALEALMEKAQTTYNIEPDRFKDFLNHRNEKGKTALWQSAEQNHRESTMQLLLQYGADYLITDKFNASPLHMSSWNVHPKVVALLLAESSQHLNAHDLAVFINKRNTLGKTALMDASHRNCPEVINLLLDKGADYSIVDNHCFTALHYCVWRNHAASVHLLLHRLSKDETDNGAKFKRFLNQQGDNNRRSALNDAAFQNFPDLAEALLSHGAAYDNFDNQKCSPLHRALRRNFTHLAIAILERAKKDGDRERLKRLLNARDDQQKNIWSWAQERKNERVSNWLISSGIVVEGMGSR